MAEASLNESVIRDEIAARPEMIEYGLRTLATNYHLPNSEGTRGFVDVLAQDRRGMYVVIEVKRSDSAAREALHEVVKYCELLKRERGLRSDQVRAIVASTTWRELLVPFSELARTCTYPINGVELSLGSLPPGSITARAVEPLPMPPERDLSTLAIRVELERPDSAEVVWKDIIPMLNQVGVDDALGIVAGNGKRTILHVAIGTIVEGDPRIPPEGDLVQVPEDEGVEYLAAVRVVDQFPGFELVSPDRLRRITETNGLDVIRVLRAGRFEDQRSLVSDDEIVRIAEGSATWSQVRFTATGLTSQGLAWRRMRKRLDYTLAGNPSWNLLLGLWLDEIELVHPSADVVLDVHNPCDIMAALVHGGLGMELLGLLPYVQGALDLPGDVGRLLHGSLVWNGRSVENAADLIRSVYPNPHHWALLRGSGAVWESDLELLEKLGLEYALFEFPPDRLGGPNLLSVHDGQLARTLPTGNLRWPGIRSLGEWLGLTDLEQLLNEFRSTMVPVNGGDQWLTVQPPIPPSES